MKAQTLIEYLITYGWAILIIIIVTASLYALGVFDPKTFTGEIDDIGFSESLKDMCDEYAKYKYDKGYYYAIDQLSKLLECFHGSDKEYELFKQCLNASANVTCLTEYIDEYNKPFGSGYYETDN